MWQRKMVQGEKKEVGVWRTAHVPQLMSRITQYGKHMAGETLQKKTVNMHT